MTDNSAGRLVFKDRYHYHHDHDHDHHHLNHHNHQLGMLVGFSDSYHDHHCTNIIKLNHNDNHHKNHNQNQDDDHHPHRIINKVFCWPGMRVDLFG